MSLELLAESITSVSWMSCFFTLISRTVSGSFQDLLKINISWGHFLFNYCTERIRCSLSPVFHHAEFGNGHSTKDIA